MNTLAVEGEAGMVWTNDLGHSCSAGPAPWGLRKQSGFGLTHSLWTHRRGLAHLAKRYLRG